MKQGSESENLENSARNLRAIPGPSPLVNPLKKQKFIVLCNFMILLNTFLLSFSLLVLFYQIFEISEFYFIGYIMIIAIVRIALNTFSVCKRKKRVFLLLFHLNIEDIGIISSTVFFHLSFKNSESKFFKYLLAS